MGGAEQPGEEGGEDEAEEASKNGGRRSSRKLLPVTDVPVIMQRVFLDRLLNFLLRHRDRFAQCTLC